MIMIATSATRTPIATPADCRTQSAERPPGTTVIMPVVESLIFPTGPGLAVGHEAGEREGGREEETKGGKEGGRE